MKLMPRLRRRRDKAASITGLWVVSLSLLLLGACEKYVYFWDDYGHRPSRPYGQGNAGGSAPDQSGRGNNSRAAGAVVVAKGDTLYGLARRYGLVLRDLIDANRLKPPYILKPGQRLKTPAARLYIVAKGDTAYSIARRHGVDVYSLIKLNRLPPDAAIKAGQRLQLPPPVSSSSPVVSVSARPQAKSPEPKDARTATVRPQAKPSKIKQMVAAPPRLDGKGFTWPVRGKVILPYGKQSGGRFNDGINIVAEQGADIRAAQSGVVVYVGNELPGFGNLLIVKHADGWSSAYAQCRDILVKRGQTVRKGQVVGRVGATGNVSKPQLHFELRRRARPVDPRPHLA